MISTVLSSLAALSLVHQVVVVEVLNSAQPQAAVSLWEKTGRESRKNWHEVIHSVPAVVGKNGLAPEGAKREGDGKTPSGVFELGRVFGEAPSSRFQGHLSYLVSSSDWVGVDDPQSKYYNQVVQKSQVATVDWNSHEEILRTDAVYRWLLEIRANPENTPGLGSLIFMHLWKDSRTGTAGCVAMAEDGFLKIVRRLDPALNPRVFIRLKESARSASSPKSAKN